MTCCSAVWLMASLPSCCDAWRRGNSDADDRRWRTIPRELLNASIHIPQKLESAGRVRWRGLPRYEMKVAKARRARNGKRKANLGKRGVTAGSGICQKPMEA